MTRIRSWKSFAHASSSCTTVIQPSFDGSRCVRPVSSHPNLPTLMKPLYLYIPQVYRSSKPGLGVRVYFMMYVNSAEESKYLSSVTKEKLAFERLIREKGVSLPVTSSRISAK